MKALKLKIAKHILETDTGVMRICRTFGISTEDAIDVMNEFEKLGIVGKFDSGDRNRELLINDIGEIKKLIYKQ